MDRLGWRGCGGQATTELVIGLVALMAVFMGLLQVASLSRDNVENLIEARESADRNVGNGTLGGAGRPIVGWDEGDDGLSFTADDTAAVGTTEDAGLFSGELGAPCDLGALPTAFTGHNFLPELDTLYLFHSAANLTSAEVSRRVELEDAVRALIDDRDRITLKDQVYMPRED